VEHFQHFGLSEDPFRNEPRLRDFFDTTVSRAALSRLERGLRQAKGLMVLTGGVGSGKTMILRQLLETLEEEIFEASMLVVLNGAADADWMLTRFARQLGVEEPETEREALLGQVYEQLAIVREDGRHAVLLIDDAHALAERSTLREVCGLLKLEYEERRLFSLVLAGGPELDLAIASDPTLAHKVEVKVPLRSLEREASAAYLAQRIQQAGGSPAIVDEGAEEALHRLGAGLPGRMNTLADNALFEAFLCGRTRLSAADVERVHHDLGWDMPPAEDGAVPAPRAAPVPAPAAAATAPAATEPMPSAEPELETGPAASVGEVPGIDPIPGPIAEPELESLEALTGEAPLEMDAPTAATILDDEDLDSDLEAVFDVGLAEVLPTEGPPKDEEDLVVELLNE
jgi:type II secretory pathway predicted ATPase ExeA